MSWKGSTGSAGKRAPTPRGPRPEPAGARAPNPCTADFFFSPGLLGILPLPYGEAAWSPAGMDPCAWARGGSLRWAFPVRRTTALRVALTPAAVDPEPPPQGRRLALLTATGHGTDSARAWSQRACRWPCRARELAENLARALRSSSATPWTTPPAPPPTPCRISWNAATRATARYFASALAVMLRYRGIPARVVNGFRLGPWIEEGGYFLVTQNEAHSWVEYYDPEAGGWRAADPTPPAPPSRFGAETFLATLARWADAMRFRWDRNVVRFSDEDQVAGLDRLTLGFGALARWRPRPLAMALGILGLGEPWPGSCSVRGGRPGPGRIRAAPAGSASWTPWCAAPAASCRPGKRRPPGPGWNAWPRRVPSGRHPWPGWPGRRTRRPTGTGPPGG